MPIDNINNDLYQRIGADRLAQSGKKDALGQRDFLKLMTAQLNNQDPLKPMESGEFFNQISQFSVVSGVNDLNDSFSQIANAMFSSQALQASAMVGRSVLYQGSQLSFNGNKPVTGEVSLPSGTSQLLFNIYDQNGEVVRRIDMGAQPSGSIAFQWDGNDQSGKPAIAGTYYLGAEAKYGTETVALDTYIHDNVESVSIGSNGTGVTLNLSDGTKVALSSVKKIS